MKELLDAARAAVRSLEGFQPNPDVAEKVERLRKLVAKLDEAAGADIIAAKLGGEVIALDVTRNEVTIKVGRDAQVLSTRSAFFKRLVTELERVA